MQSVAKSALLSGLVACLATAVGMLAMFSRTLSRHGDVGILVGGALFAATFILGPFLASRRGWFGLPFSLERCLSAAIPLIFLPVAFFIGLVGWGDIQEHWIRAALHWMHRDIPADQVDTLVLSISVTVEGALAGLLLWISISTLTKTWSARSLFLYCPICVLLIVGFWALMFLGSGKNSLALILPVAGSLAFGALFAMAIHWNRADVNLYKPLFGALSFLVVLAVFEVSRVAAMSVPEKTFPEANSPPVWTMDLAQAGCRASHEPTEYSAPNEITFAGNTTIGMAVPWQAVPLGNNKWKYSSCLFTIDAGTGKKIAQTTAPIYEPSIAVTPKGDFSVAGIEGRGEFTTDLKQIVDHDRKTNLGPSSGTDKEAAPPEWTYFRANQSGELWFEKDGGHKLLVPNKCGGAQPQLLSENRVLVICADGFRVFDREGGLVTWESFARPGVHLAAVSREGRRFALSIYVWGFGDPSYLEEEKIVVFETASVKPIFSVEADPLPEHQSWVALSPDGSLLAVGAKSTLRMFRLPSKESQEVR